MHNLVCLTNGSAEFIHLENLSTLECLAVLTAAKRQGLKVESVGCWTQKGDYFKIHLCEFFCEDYLIDIEGWEFHAFEQLRITYEKTILSSDPSNFPLFEVEITKEWHNPERVRLAAEEVKKLRADREYTPKDFNTYYAPIGFEID